MAARTLRMTTRTVAALKRGQTASESLGYGAGALEAKCGNAGARFYYRYGTPQRRVSLPAHNDQGEPLGLAEARTLARALSARTAALAKDGRDLADVLAEEKREAVRAREAERQAEPEKSASLLALLDEYADLLQARGKVDHRDVRRMAKNHLAGPFPALAAKPAADVALGDVLVILQRLVKAHKLRTAQKLRAYLRAAYAAGIGATFSAQASALRRFRLEANPAALVSALEDASRPRERALSIEELRALWARLCRPDERLGALLRFYLLTGGQRFDQLRRATRTDIREGELVLWDGKGRRVRPRRHAVPLLPEALAALDAMTTPMLGHYVFSLTRGQTPADGGAVRRAVQDLAARMVAIGEVVEPFTLSDLRRTVETRLAAAGVPAEVRAQLQSHGLGGVQARHYDRHGYEEEKRAALERLRGLLEPGVVARLPAWRHLI